MATLLNLVRSSWTIAALMIAAYTLVPREARAWTPPPASCPADKPFYIIVGDSVVCDSSCWGLYPKQTEWLPLTPSHYAGKYCVARCEADFSYENDGICVQACPSSKKPDANKVCQPKTALDLFQDQCTGLRFAIRNDGGLPNGTYYTYLGNISVTGPTYANKSTPGGWLCLSQCPLNKTIVVQGDGDARCQ
jgi:hypothetical protein